MSFLAPHDQSVALWRAVFDATSEATLVTDTDGHILLLNRQFEELWRLTPEHLEMTSPHRRIKHLAHLVCDPEQFLSRSEEFYSNPILKA